MKRIVLMVMLLALLNTETLYAGENEQYDFSDIDRVLREHDEEIDFEDTVIRVGKGDTGVFGELIDSTLGSLKREIIFGKDNIRQLIVIAIFAGILTLISDIFNNSSISDTGFGIVYMITAGIVTAGFAAEVDIAENVMKTLMEFMQTLMPTYLLAVSASGQGMTSSTFYELTMIIILVIEWMFFKVFIPLVKIYVIISVVDYMSKERVLSKFSEIIKKMIGWILKTSVYAVAGVNLIEGIVFPSIDAATVANVSRVASSIPGMSGVSSLSGIALGSGMLIKNTIGGVGLISILVICAIPVVKTGIASFVYQLLAGALQPVTDKRIVGCISIAGEGIEFLLKAVITCGLLFMITIAIICLSTNATYYGMG